MNKIKIIELTKNYQSNKQNQLVLDNLNAEINLTGLTSLQGKSGSGKSTLMHILSGLLKPTSGRVLVNEIEINRTKPIERSSLISFVYQFHALLENLSVYENIYLPRKIHKNYGSDEFISDNASENIFFDIRFHLYPEIQVIKTMSGENYLIQFRENKY